ncbi:hypothetical protein E4U53_004152, partial [Claviceps sorghi]
SKSSPFDTGNSAQKTNVSVNNPFASASTAPSTSTAFNVFAPTASPFSSFLAPKKDDQEKTRTEMLGTVSQTPTNPFAETSATKSFFGDQKNASQNTSLAAQSVFAWPKSNQSAATDSLPVNGPFIGEKASTASSLSMSPSPEPPQPISSTNQPSAPSTSILQDGWSSPATFFSTQNQPIPALGQSSAAAPSTTHFGSAPVGDNGPVDLTKTKDTTAAATDVGGVGGDDDEADADSARHTASLFARYG